MVNKPQHGLQDEILIFLAKASRFRKTSLFRHLGCQYIAKNSENNVNRKVIQNDEPTRKSIIFCQQRCKLIEAFCQKKK